MGNFFTNPLVSPLGSMFGKKGKAPQYPTITAPTVTSGADYYGGAMNFGNQNFGQAMGARESALSDINNPNYYAGFQPSSFEQAMGNQYFQNVWPDQQAYMSNILSKSGQAYAPTAAATLGKAYGNTSFNIGQYLSGQGEQRANNSLNARLNIDPMSQILSPYAQFGAQQGNLQDSYSFQAQKQNADAQYANQMQQYLQKQQQQSMLGTLIGGGLGAFAGPQGAMIGAGIGGSLMGGGQNMGSYMQGASGLPNTWGGGQGIGMGSQGYGQAQPVYGNMTNNVMQNPNQYGMGNYMSNFGGGGMQFPMPGQF